MVPNPPRTCPKLGVGRPVNLSLNPLVDRNLPEPKLKSIVKSVRLSLPKPADLESLGPAARSRYDTDPKEDWPRRERSRHRADTSVHPKDSPHSKSRSDKGSERSDRGTGRHDRKSGQSSSHKSKKDVEFGRQVAGPERTGKVV